MSIRAMNWAMDQATGDPRSQCLLYVLADCANPEGTCWPAIKYMAAKSQQSKATVQRRLKELEDMGAIARFPRWEDEDGKVNSEGRGRRTSDEIRLLLDRSIALNGGDDDAEDGAPPSQADTGGSQADTAPVAQLSDGPPSHCGDPYMNRNTEPEKIPPNPPLGGCATADVECEGWQEFKTAFEADGDPIVRVSLAHQLFAALSPDERARCTKAAKGLIAHRVRQKKPPSKPSAQTFIREVGGWPSWIEHCPPHAVPIEPPTFVVEGSTEWQAMCVLARIRGETDPQPRRYPDREQAGLLIRKPLTPAKLALARFYLSDPATWAVVEQGSQQCGAWQSMAGAEPHLVATGETKRQQIGSKVIEDWPVKLIGLRIPWPWPPRKDGSLCDSAA